MALRIRLLSRSIADDDDARSSITKQPIDFHQSSEEWHIAVGPCSTEYMLIDEASRACAKTNRRLTRGLIDRELKIACKRSLSKIEASRTIALTQSPKTNRSRKRIAAMQSRTHGRKVVNGLGYDC